MNLNKYDNSCPFASSSLSSSCPNAGVKYGNQRADSNTNTVHCFALCWKVYNRDRSSTPSMSSRDLKSTKMRPARLPN